MPPGTRLAVAALALALPARAAAQRVEFPGAPWGAARPAVAAAIEALGYTAERDTTPGMDFAAGFSAGSTRLVAMFGRNGLSMLNQIHPLPPSEARRRFAELRDSLVRVLGEPDSAGTGAVWVRTDGRIELFVRPDSGGLTSAAILNRAAPNYLADLRAMYQATVRAEENRRSAWLAARLDSARWMPLFVKDSAAISLERGSVERLEGGAWRVTVRWDWLTPRGGGGLHYDAMVHATEVRCGEGTYRVGRTQWLLGETPGDATSARWGRWNRPVPTSGGNVIVSRFCDYARTLPEPESPRG